MVFDGVKLSNDPAAVSSHQANTDNSTPVQVLEACFRDGDVEMFPDPGHQGPQHGPLPLQ